MKKFNIPSPKLKNTRLCFLFFHSPAIASALLMVAMLGIESIFGITENLLLAFISFVLLFAIICANPLINFYCLGSTYSFLRCVRAWQNVRLWYKTDANGKTREEAEKIIEERMKKRGTNHAPVPNFLEPVCVQYVFDHRKNILSALLSQTDKICLLYSVPHLDEKSLESITLSARKNISALVKETRKRYGIRLASAVIILADKISIDTSLLEAKASKYNNEILLTCVADISSGKYFFDSLKYPCAFMDFPLFYDNDTPVKNYAVDIAADMLFGGKLPLDGNENFLEWNDISLETSFLDYIRATYKKINCPSEIFAHLIPADTPMFRKNFLYFKTCRKTVAWEYETDAKDDRKIHVITMYSYAIKPHFQMLNNRERLEIQKKIRISLEEKGYTVIFHDE